MHRALRLAFVFEMFVNVVCGVIYMAAPDLLVGGMLPAGARMTFPASAEALVWSLFGALVAASAPILGFATKTGGNAARACYWSLAIGEIMCLPLAARYINRFGVWGFQSYAFVGALAGGLVARLAVLILAPHWFVGADRKTH